MNGNTQPPPYSSVGPGNVPVFQEQPPFQNMAAPLPYSAPVNVLPPQGCGGTQAPIMFLNFNQTSQPAPAPAPPPPPPPVQSIIVETSNEPLVVPVESYPTNIKCPRCKERVITRVKYVSNSSTHCWALILFLVFAPCVLLPYCIGSCKTANHFCPNCNSFVGSYNNF